MTVTPQLRKKRAISRPAPPVQDAAPLPSIDAATLPLDRSGAIRLIQEWLAEPSDYDEEAWLLLRADLEANRLSQRRRFHE